MTAHTSNELSYDTEGIMKITKKRLIFSLILLVLSVSFIICAVLMIAFFGGELLIFVGAAVLMIVGLFLLFKETKKLSLISLFSLKGKISEIELDVKGVNDMKTANFSVTRPKYSKYWRDEIRCRVYIQKGERTRSFKLNNITKKQAEYYEKKGAAMHIFATRFPVRLDPTENEWLCPLCGEFNTEETATCGKCNNKVLKDH